MTSLFCKIVPVTPAEIAVDNSKSISRVRQDNSPLAQDPENYFQSQNRRGGINFNKIGNTYRT